MTNHPDMQAIATAVVEEYIANGTPVRAEAIATRLGWSTSKVQRRIREANGFVPGCRYEEVEVATYSKSYRSMQHGVVRASAYLPMLSTLRQMVLDSRKAV